MNTKREKLTKRLVMLLAMTALALLMVWTGSLVRADDNTVPATEMASDTDAVSETSTEVSTEITTSENTESSTEVNTESTTEATTTASTETSEAGIKEDIPTVLTLEPGDLTIYSTDTVWSDAIASVNADAIEYIGASENDFAYVNQKLSQHHFLIAEDSAGNSTVAYCMQPYVQAPGTNGIVYAEGHVYPKEIAVASTISSLRFGYGGTNADPNVVYSNGTWKKKDDGGTYGTYVIPSTSEAVDTATENVKVVRGLMIGGKVYPMGVNQARAMTGLLVHSVSPDSTVQDGYNGDLRTKGVTAITGTDNSNLYPAYNHMLEIAEGTRWQYNNAGLTTLDSLQVMDSKSYYQTNQSFTWEVYNTETNTWEIFSSAPSPLTDTYVDATTKQVKFRVTYTSSNMCNKLIATNDNGTSGNVTIKHTGSQLTVGNTTDYFDYFTVGEDTDNSVPFEVSYSGLKAKTQPETDSWAGYSYQEEVFIQDAIITVNSTDLGNANKSFKVKVVTQEGASATPFYSASNGYATRMYKDKETYYDYQDIAFTSPLLVVSSKNTTLTAKLENTAYVKVKKASSNPDYTNGNACYNLAGTEYRLYTDAACTTPAIDVDGNEVVFVCDENGDTVVREMTIGDYWLKETVAGKGYMLNLDIEKVTLTAEHSVNPKIVDVTDDPVEDPIEIVLSKAGDGRKLKGAIYCIEFYPGVQSYNEEAIKTTYSGTPRKWYLETDENGRAHFDEDYITDEPGFVSDEFYLDAVGMPTFPLGSIIIYEAKAPNNYKVDPTHYTYKVLQTSSTQYPYADIFELENGQDVPAGALNASNELEEGFTDEPLFADLTIKKVPAETNPPQGSIGDATVDGAIFAIYAKRNVIDTASGEIAVESGKTYSAKTALTYEDGTAVTDVYGRQLYAEAGDLKPVVIMPATDENGETTVEGLPAAANADDYYVVELAPPKGYVGTSTPMSVDLRDNTDKTAVLEAIEYKYEFGDYYLKQPVEVIKYTIDDSDLTPKLKKVNDVEFQLYLISDLKNKDAAIKFIDSNGKPVYDFSNYDFSNETPVVLKQDGSTKLVMGSGGIDGYDKTEPLIYGEYVVVESYTPDNLEPVDPEVISLPKYKTDSDGNKQFDTTNTPLIYAMYDHSVLNEQVEKLVKINKKDEEGKFVIHSNATFSVWDVSDIANADTASIEDIKANAKRVSQYQITPTGFVEVDSFDTNSEGFIIFYQAFKYGKYAVIEEEAPVGYTLSKEPVLFDVKSEALYLLMDNGWEEATKYYDSTNREYWEVTVTNVDYEINAAKFDSDTGLYLPNAELTIYRAVDETGTIAVDENNNPIVLKAQDANGDLVEAVWTTDDTWVKFNAVPSGYYVLRETKTPAGYATRKDITLYVGDDPAIAPNGVRVITGEDTIYYSFEKTDDGVKFVNTDRVETDSVKVELAIPNDVITVELSKKDASTDGELPGAELTLYRVTEGEDDELIETWVSESTPHVVKGLTPGWYKLVENTVPLGYYTEDNTIEFEVTDTNEIQKQHMLNHPLELKVTKESFKAGTPVAGATLSLYRKSDGKCLDNCDFDPDKATMTDAETGEPLHLVETWISTTEPHVISKLYPGEYVLVEELAPHGYTTADPIEFTVTDQSRIAPIAIYDELIEIYVQIHKTGESLVSAESVESEYGDYTKFVWDDVNLEGVQFDVKNTDGDIVATLITDENGIATSQQLEFGDYTVEEQVPYGMIDDGVIYKISYKWIPGMQEENLTASLEVYNESCNTQVNVNKIAEEVVLKDGEYQYVTKPLEGALFAVYAREDIENYYGEIIAKSGTCLGYAVTDEAGVASFNDKLIKGNYYYTELKSAGPQYVLDSQIYNFDLLLENSKTNVFNLNESFPVTNNLVKGDIAVLKIAEDGKVPLAGVEFDLYNSDNIVIDHLTTGTDGKAKTKVLPYGKYYLKETKALEGYQLEDTKFEVTVVEDGVTTVVTIENRKTPKLGVTTMVTITGLMLILGILVMSVLGKFKRIKDEE